MGWTWWVIVGLLCVIVVEGEIILYTVKDLRSTIARQKVDRLTYQNRQSEIIFKLKNEVAYWRRKDSAGKERV